MPNNVRFPPSTEIRRAIAAATRAGIDVGFIEIHPDKITIYPRHDGAPGITDYDLWKMDDRRDTSLIRHADEGSEAPPAKPKG